MFASSLDAAPHPGHHEIVRRLKDLEIDDTTPRQALELVAELKKLTEE